MSTATSTSTPSPSKPPSPMPAPDISKHKYQLIPVDQLKESKTNPRQHYAKEELQELTDSVRTFGVIEPLIVASIIVVCVCNFVGTETGRTRGWLAGGFGLLHGFGFASVLRETGFGEGDTSVAVPLFAFNAGVEVGQIALAAVFMPALFLIRRWPRWQQYGTSLVSCSVIVISAYWLWQRVFVG